METVALGVQITVILLIIVVLTVVWRSSSKQAEYRRRDIEELAERAEALARLARDVHMGAQEQSTDLKQVASRLTTIDESQEVIKKELGADGDDVPTVRDTIDEIDRKTDALDHKTDVLEELQKRKPGAPGEGNPSKK